MSENPVVIVTGGGTGIGAATARLLAGRGWGVTVTGRRLEPIRAVADEIGGLAIAGDTADSSHAGDVVAQTLDRHGRIDGLVLNAGVGGLGSLDDVDVGAFEAVMRTNLVGPLRFAAAAVGALRASRGAIVTVSSVAGLRASPGSLAYCSSKAALIMLTQCIALDHGPEGIRANCVCPGWTRTDMGDSEMDELGEALDVDREQAYARVTRHVPLRRPATADEVATSIAWLLSPDAAFVTGAVVTVDGGGAVVDVATLPFSEAG